MYSSPELQLLSPQAPLLVLQAEPPELVHKQ
jgi:hypothetical protein